MKYWLSQFFETMPLTSLWWPHTTVLFVRAYGVHGLVRTTRTPIVCVGQ